MDRFFEIKTLRATQNPQQLVWLAAHQDYCEDPVSSEAELAKVPSEAEAGDIIIKKLLAGGRGHYGPFEHPQITLNASYFPHSVMQQLRTHRISVSFDVQSGRYTGQRIIDVTTGKRDVEEVFYLRPIGNHNDRRGKKYYYSGQQRTEDVSYCLDLAERYQRRICEGLSEEHARGLIAFDVRQHFVVSFNARSLMHTLDLRWKKDAQPECQQFSDLLFVEFEKWMPAIARWYEDNRGRKARLSP
jgi:thymidylate synthase (FAD)